MSSFEYTAQFLTSIERTISRERLKRYLVATQQRMVNALELYEYNVALSEALYGYLHGLEVAVRNAMHHSLTLGNRTPQWYDEASLTSYHQEKFIQKAKKEAGWNASAGKIIAELTLGFWTDLTAQAYHNTLWVPYLAQAFPHAKRHRKLIHQRLQLIRWLRNRIAHHEPILTSRNLIYTGHQSHISLPELVECAEWICPDTSEWLRIKSRYTQAEVILARVNTLGVTL